jgi:hypothetical protein
MLHPGQEVRPLRPIVVQHLSFMHVETVQAPRGYSKHREDTASTVQAGVSVTAPIHRNTDMEA